MIKEHLTEKHIKNFLNIHFKDHNFKSKRLIINDVLFITDFMSYDKKTIVEFDGYHHFSVYDRISKDMMMIKYCEKNNINLIRIPYFVQFNSSDIIKHYFGIDVEPYNDYAHGFISDVALRPCDFNQLGYDRYMYILSTLPSYIAEQIKATEDDFANKINDKYSYI